MIFSKTSEAAECLVAVEGLVTETLVMKIGFVGCPNGHGE